MTKAKTQTPEDQAVTPAPEATTEDQAPAVETTQDATIPAPEAPPVDPGADAPIPAPEAPPVDPGADAQAVAASEEVFEAKHIEDLNHLAKTIDMLNTTGHRLGLVDELRNLWGAEIVESDGLGVTIAMQNITTEPSESLDTALANWANAARRKIAAAAG